MSLNGKIADSDGGVDWLESIPNPNEDDYGYIEFVDSIDATIQGSKTYQQIIDWNIEFPYADKKNYVVSNKQSRQDTEFVEFITDNHIEFIKLLREETGKDIWLIGGGRVNTMLLNANLIDELQVYVIPIVLSGGIELFEHIPKETRLTLRETQAYSSGVVELKYGVN